MLQIRRWAIGHPRRRRKELWSRFGIPLISPCQNAISPLLQNQTREEFMAAELDLKKLDLEELTTLSKDIERAIRKLETNNLKKAREAAEAAAKEYGFSLKEVTGAKTPRRRNGEKSEAKYRDPNDPNQTWSGRGRQPQWFKDAVAGGRSLKELVA
jgi:DNA-binding protein H-NS